MSEPMNEEKAREIVANYEEGRKREYFVIDFAKGFLAGLEAGRAEKDAEIAGLKTCLNRMSDCYEDRVAELKAERERSKALVGAAKNALQVLDLEEALASYHRRNEGSQVRCPNNCTETIIHGKGCSCGKQVEKKEGGKA